MSSIPEHYTCHGQTKAFDQDTIPKGLLRDHNTRAGVWGRVQVTSGRLRLTWADDGSVQWLDAKAPGVIPPERRHSVAADGDVQFQVFFYSDPQGK